MKNKEEFLKRIFATFRIEAEENINALSSDLIELEKNPPDPRRKELIEVIYRAAHSLKGAARAVDMIEIESLCHAFEGVMSAVRLEKIILHKAVYNLLHQSVDLLDSILNSTDGKVSPVLNDKINNQVKKLSDAEAGEVIEEDEELVVGLSKPQSESEQKPEPEPESMSEPNTVDPVKPVETIRVSTQKLDKLLVQAEEMLVLKLSSTQLSHYIKNVLEKFSTWEKEFSAIVSSTTSFKQLIDTGDSVITSKYQADFEKILQFCEWNNSHIGLIEKDLHELLQFSNQEAFSNGAKIESLLEDVKELITIPFSTVLDIFPKMIRDISKGLGKEIDFIVEGDDTEIDRRILEKIRHPLIHIIRNSIDYGIEKPEERLLNGKARKGRIKIKIERLENSKVEILVSDDGAGINLEKLKKIYIKNEKIRKEDVDKITDKDYINYIFSSGVSTKDIVTDLSGRGLGLAIVQDTIDQLGGHVVVSTEAGKSTTFKIQLPLSLVTFRGILIDVSDSRYIIPTSRVDRVLRLNKEEIKSVENKLTMLYNEKIIPLTHLSDVLELQKKENLSQFEQIIVLADKGRTFGFIIDNLEGEQEVLVKKFNKQLEYVRNISGATILGSGEVVPILKVSDLFKSSLRITSASPIALENRDDEEKQNSVLVVEDSITSRMLLKNILEATGYHVETAIDGADGFIKLKEGEFNAVVSDIEMPRMNGFELTAKIRADKKMADMPVILVTSLSKPEDKEKGIDVGANAYIIKSSFDQSNLLEILDRLI